MWTAEDPASVTQSTLSGPAVCEKPGIPGRPPRWERERPPPVTRSHMEAAVQQTTDGSVHSAEVQDQFGVTVGLQDHGDAPVLLVEVAGGVVGDLAVLGLGAVAGRGAGGNVQHALGHVG